MDIRKSEPTEKAGKSLVIGLFAVATLAAALLLLSCSSAGETSQDQTGPAELDRAETSANAQDPVPGDRPQASANTPGPNPGSDAQDQANTAPIAMSRQKRSEAIRQAGDAPMPNIEALLRQSAKPAPEGSEFSVALTDILIERRVFPRHPQLSKVEKVTKGIDKTIYVFTRDGRQMRLPGNAIEHLSTAPTASILKAANIERLPQAPVDSKPRARDTNQF